MYKKVKNVFKFGYIFLVRKRKNSELWTSHMHNIDSTEWTDKTDKVYEWEFMMITELENENVFVDGVR